MKSENLTFAWGITGAGTYLRETYRAILEVKQSLDADVTTFLSEAGEEVVRIYGLKEKLESISPGGYHKEIITREKAGASCVYSGRFNRKEYEFLFCSPATANTVGKVVNGIADTVVTTIISQAIKGETPVILLPTDLTGTETSIPCRVERNGCTGCEICVVECPQNTINLVEGKALIDLSDCIGCTICVEVCPENTIYCWEKITITPRKKDLKNIQELSNMEGIRVIKTPEEIKEAIQKIV